jgi:hypothetical protein
MSPGPKRLGLPQLLNGPGRYQDLIPVDPVERYFFDKFNDGSVISGRFLINDLLNNEGVRLPLSCGGSGSARLQALRKCQGARRPG